MKFAGITIDSHDPKKAALFYAELLGVGVQSLPDRFMVTKTDTPIYFTKPESGFRNAFQWPDTGDKMFHLEIATENLEKDVERAVSLGAVILDESTGELSHGQAWVVMEDPTGHPFCIVDYAVLMGS